MKKRIWREAKSFQSSMKRLFLFEAGILRPKAVDAFSNNDLFSDMLFLALEKNIRVSFFNVKKILFSKKRYAATDFLFFRKEWQ